jgi:histidine ammonia-lyase
MVRLLQVGEVNRVAGTVALDGRTLGCWQVREVARGGATVTVTDGGRERARAAARAAADIAGRRQVYGRTTGVGANRDQPVHAADSGDHGYRLLRSHAGGGGPLIAPELSRAMLVVRANQIAAGGSGVDPGVFGPLLEGINAGLHVPVPRYGAIGTGDLTALAVAVLCLLGERDWRPAGARQPRFALASSDAPAFLSSNAATIGEAAIACCDLAELLQAAVVIAALSHRAVGASTEPYAAPVHEARGHPGQREVAAILRGLLAQAGPGTRVQDPYGYRAMPQVHGPAVDAVRHAERVLATEVNAAAENPLIDTEGGTVWHNGNFHAAYLGLALDAVRAALFQTAALSAARLGTLVEPAFTGLRPFLATDPPPSSGIMILEYVAQSSIADIRRFASPAALGSAVLSRGVEEHAAFSTQSARATTDAVEAYRFVLASELVAAVRALRLRGIEPRSAEWRNAELHDAELHDAEPHDTEPRSAGPGSAEPGSAEPGSPEPPGTGLGAGLAAAFDLAARALPDRTADRALDGDLEAAQGLLPAFAAFAQPGA